MWLGLREVYFRSGRAISFSPCSSRGTPAVGALDLFDEDYNVDLDIDNIPQFVGFLLRCCLCLSRYSSHVLCRLQVS